MPSKLLGCAQARRESFARMIYSYLFVWASILSLLVRKSGHSSWCCHAAMCASIQAREWLQPRTTWSTASTSHCHPSEQVLEQRKSGEGEVVESFRRSASKPCLGLRCPYAASLESRASWQVGKPRTCHSSGSWTSSASNISRQHWVRDELLKPRNPISASSMAQGSDRLQENGATPAR